MIINRLKELLIDIYTLYKNKHYKLKQKFIILLAYLIISVKNFLNNRIFNFKRVRFLNLTIKFNSFTEVFSLIREIFIADSYYFESDNTNPYIIDCGSNIGMSILYFKYLYPNAIIDAFEPTPSICHILNHNILNNQLDHVTTYELAVSDQIGVSNIFIKDNLSVANTLVKEEANGGKKVSIKTDKLSNYINKDVDLLKIDVQLSELKVFEDLYESKKILSIKQIIMEYHYLYGYEDNNFPRLLEILDKSNFIYTLNLNGVKSGGFATYTIKAKKNI